MRLSYYWHCTGLFLILQQLASILTNSLLPHKPLTCGVLPIDRAVYYDFQCGAFCLLPIVTKYVFSISELVVEFNSLDGQYTGVNCLCKVPVLLDVMHNLSCPD